MPGYCLYGQAPVLCSVSRDVDAHLAQIDADEYRAEQVDARIADAVDCLMQATDQRDILVSLCDAGKRRDVRIERIYNAATGECTAQTGDEWQRVLYLCDDKHLHMLRQQWREWCVSVLSDNEEVQSKAEKLADADDEQAREDEALMRAGVDA